MTMFPSSPWSNTNGASLMSNIKLKPPEFKKAGDYFIKSKTRVFYEYTSADDNAGTHNKLSTKEFMDLFCAGGEFESLGDNIWSWESPARGMYEICFKVINAEVKEIETLFSNNKVISAKLPSGKHVKVKLNYPWQPVHQLTLRGVPTEYPVEQLAKDLQLMQWGDVKHIMFGRHKNLGPKWANVRNNLLHVKMANAELEKIPKVFWLGGHSVYVTKPGETIKQTCGYCNKPWHVEETCFKKREDDAHEKREQEKRKRMEEKERYLQHLHDEEEAQRKYQEEQKMIQEAAELERVEEQRKLLEQQKENAAEEALSQEQEELTRNQNALTQQVITEEANPEINKDSIHEANILNEEISSENEQDDDDDQTECGSDSDNDEVHNPATFTDGNPKVVVENESALQERADASTSDFIAGMEVPHLGATEEVQNSKDNTSASPSEEEEPFVVVNRHKKGKNTSKKHKKQLPIGSGNRVLRSHSQRPDV